MSSATGEVRLVVFDWAGTTIDFGSFAPVASFIKAFHENGIDVTPAEARGPMGLHKKDHIREMFRLPAVAERWYAAHGQDWLEADVETVYTSFIPLQLEVIDQFSTLVPGVLGTVAELRRRGIKIGGTTGYFRASAEAVLFSARRQGYEPDLSLCPEDVSAGRPAPWMIFRIMETLGVYPAVEVVKVGDTAPDIAEARNAGAWAVGVTATGSEVGLTEAEWRSLDDGERRTKARAAEKKLREAGAHFVVPSVAEIPELLDEINARLRSGGKP